MTSLKQCDIENLRTDPNLTNQFTNYDNIIQLCRNQPPIPPISLAKSTKILQTLKKNVSDFFSVTALHYQHAGREGLVHYNCLLNAIVSDVNNSKIEELNMAHGNILYKGHKKERTSDRSYRTISSCPFLAKSIDYYLRELYHDCWDSCQAATQYQGSGSSHELASLLVTEALQYSLNVSNKPVFMLALDAQSAFDRCLRQILCGELYKSGVPGNAILFMDSRLESRLTVYEWDGQMMGPAKDDTGFEQGGINSSDYYKMYNNEQLESAQCSGLGVDVGSAVISAAGQADDVILLSNDIYCLKLLVKLTEDYCKKYRVQLEPKKTKLLGFYNKNTELLVKLAAKNNPIAINGTKVNFTNEAEHVGVVRNTAGNMPNILCRVAEHKKALGAVLSAGMARGHRGSPAAALRVHRLHCLPVLFSGLASLVLNRAETEIVDKHYQFTIQNLQRLHQKTPRSIIFFLAGSLPGEAILHMRQLTLFSMICHLTEDPLHHHAKYVLTYLAPSSLSWFHQIRDICLQYCLPHPLILLETPIPKNRFKRLVKLKVTDHWRQVLIAECTSPSLTSLRYFNPHKASLTQPHPIWSSSAGNSYECGKGTILARMVSGRYRTEMMCRFWSTNRSGYCLAPTCHLVHGDLEHLLVVCPSLEHIRHRLHSLWVLKTADCPPLQRLIMWILGSPPQILLKFILDSTAWPQLITLVQVLGQEVQDRVCYLTRTWAFAIHRQKMKMLGRWPENGKAKSNKARSPTVPDTAPNPSFIPSPSLDPYQTSDNNGLEINNSFSHLPNNMITNPTIFPVMLTLPHRTSTSLPASTTPGPAASASPHRCSTALPASSIVVQHDEEFPVPDIPTTVHHDQPPDAKLGTSSFTFTNSAQSVKCVVELNKNLTGHVRGHGVTDCSPSSVAGHHHPESANTPSQSVCHANCQNSCMCSQP